MGRNRRVTLSAEETLAWGVELGKNFHPNQVVCFFGELGAGKTTLIKGIAHGATGIPFEQVCSPTFTYLHIYEERLFHFDLYRLQGVDEFLSLGFEEYFFAGGISCIEWSERIAPLLPSDAIHIKLSHREEHGREIEISGCEIPDYCR